MPVTRTPDGVDIAWYDLADETGAGHGGRPVLLCHATGFHGHVWLPTAERLGAAGFHCYSFDERGHGDSGRPADGDFAWTGFATDALAVIEAAGLGGRRPLAAGWSCGGALLLLAEQRMPATFRSLYLFEPVVPPIEWSTPPFDMPAENPLAAGARRRREVFPTRQAAYDNYASKPPLERAAREALRAYVDFGFDDLPDGTVRLKCRGEDEAAIFFIFQESLGVQSADHVADAGLRDLEPLGNVDDPRVALGINQLENALEIILDRRGFASVLSWAGHGGEGKGERGQVKIKLFAG